ncbi:zinc ribbon domain-containing protein [Rossellomorea vietnamensis]|uniref:Zinc ribbon domain-containing protein n=1 Tax=Rossellomorea vietnamensis TaxID=218284 RepID=A0A5D4M3T0_9BACI|nr:zinc ribbon domain-containing protein [Rossellomorea vietnamensis]TYR95710.1 zinc ribbon domain-containing protein [Rossellomorea vietnamensis]
MAPFYVYDCKQCGHSGEYLVKFGTEEVPCKECQEPAKKNFGKSLNTVSTGLPNGHIAIKKGLRTK